MTKFEIAEIKSEQIKQYRDFLNFGLKDDEESFRMTIDDDFNAPFPTKDQLDSFTLGAYFEGELAGIVSFERDGASREKLRHKGVLFRMYVSKKFRGRGVAKKLIEALIVRVKTTTDIEQINLTVISNNANAKKLYEKLGFIAFGLEHNAIKWKHKYFAEEQMVLKLK
jgi:ribosomal protein S18 acetylase RimI-like enzyme